jgi:glycosyltransferase involved in cell wall biosynthesis
LPFVTTEHWSGLNQGGIEQEWLSEEHVYQHADEVIVVSKALKDALQKNFHVNSCVIGNMVENRFFESHKSNEKNPYFTFVSVGRLVPIKRFDMLIHAFSQMNENNEARLVIVGDGPEKKKLSNLVRTLNLEEKVELVGLKTPEEVSNILCGADCFVLSSHRETFGIVLIEAMAKGLPVVCTRCGGPEDFVNENNGLLVPPNDAKALSIAMDEMVGKTSQYDGQKIQDYCYNNFSQDKIASQILQVYEDVLRKSN